MPRRKKKTIPGKTKIRISMQGVGQVQRGNVYDFVVTPPIRAFWDSGWETLRQSGLVESMIREDLSRRIMEQCEDRVLRGGV